MEDEDDEGGDDQPGDEAVEQEEAPETTAQATVRARATNDLHIAAQDGKFQDATNILERPDGTQKLLQQDAEGNTPLHIAAGGHKPRVTALFVQHLKNIGKQGAITPKNNDGKTPYDLASLPGTDAARRTNTIDAFN